MPRRRQTGTDPKPPNRPRDAQLAKVSANERQPPVPGPADVERLIQSGALPVWDSNRRTLSYGPYPVKHFRTRAENQILLLEAFHEDGWAGCIDDPLPPIPGIEPKKRLHFTVRRLNLNQIHRLIRFHGDGTGQRVWYEIIRNNEP